MLSIKGRIGEKSSPHRLAVTEVAVRDFRAAVGLEPDSPEIPPTFLTLCRAGEFELFQRLSLPLARVLHGEQEYAFLAPIKIGGVIEYETKLANVVEKRGSAGLLVFALFESVIRQGGANVATARSTVIVREASEGGA